MTRRSSSGGRVERLLTSLSARGLRQGLLGGDNWWLAVWIAITLWRRRRPRKPEAVYTERLALGQRLVITHEPPPLRGRKARRARRAARATASHSGPAQGDHPEVGQRPPTRGAPPPENPPLAHLPGGEGAPSGHPQPAGS